jgi:hypothetical protein
MVSIDKQNKSDTHMIDTALEMLVTPFQILEALAAFQFQINI